MDTELETLKLRPLIRVLVALVRARFWGQLTIKFKDGEAVLVHQEQQIKLS